MMRLAIFARTYTRPTLDETLDAIVNDRIGAVHFNLKCAGLESLPAAIEPATCRQVRAAFDSRGLEMVGISGTFNAIHPDREQRTAAIARCKMLIAAAASLGAGLVSLCTGTRDAADMWRAHPDNNSPEAWRQLLGTLEQLLPVAQRHHVILGIEPECANVVNTADKARRVLDELRSNCVKVILDGANLFEAGDVGDMRPRLAEAFDVLGPDIVQVHAKDIPADPGAPHQAAGTGRLDWETYFDQIARIGYRGPIVLHNLSPAQVDHSRDFVQGWIDRVTVRSP